MGDTATLSRRRFLRQGAAVVSGLAAPALIGIAKVEAAPLRGGQILPAPKFILQPSTYRGVVGIRPHRTGGFLCDTDPVLGVAQGKHIIHNYGHGGAGITLSFGCAMKVGTLVAKIIRDQPPGRPLPKVAILGSGIIGLTVAKQLRDTYPAMKLRILTKSATIAETTSIKAGGQFAPSGINSEYRTTGQMTILRGYVADSLSRIKAAFRDGSYQKYGIRERKNYTVERVADLDLCGPDIIPLPNQGGLPFTNLRREGYEYSTYLIDPPIFLAELVREMGRKQVPILWSHEVKTIPAMLALPETIIINCTGLGSKAPAFMNDTRMKPIRGALAVIPYAQRTPANLKYFFSGGCVGGSPIAYMFSRNADLVVGGSYDYDNSDTTVDPAETKRLLARMNQIFIGHPDMCV